MQDRARRRVAVRTLAALVLLFVSMAVLLSGSQPASAGIPAKPTVSAEAVSKISPRVFRDTAGGGSTSFAIYLTDQADLSAAYNLKDQDARGWYVYNTLKSHADKTQRGIRVALDARGAKYRAFWAANVIFVEGDRMLVDEMANRSDVKAIESNVYQRWIEDPSIANEQPAPRTSSPNTIEYGVQNVNAPQVWAMGFTGQGIVIGNQDTGMQWDHPALKGHYRGWNAATSTADHNYNWYDGIRQAVPGVAANPCGYALSVPCDDDRHGTHTTGTTSGDDGQGNQIGVAPGARWIGCRNMDQGTGRPETYMNCFQFFLAPTDVNGSNPNPALRPHVMNNSWGCPVGPPPNGENCAVNTFQTVIENSEASGIFVEVSAGNSGSNCSTVQDPPAIYEAAFSTGAINSTNVIANFSSRGPVTVDGSNRLKPNIVAPGVSNRSSVPSNGYANLSGTSMAGPHVVGVVALLWSARPQLARDIAGTKAILQNSANPNVTISPVQTCGGIASTTIPNNSFGYGRVDALAALASQPMTTPAPSNTATSTATWTITATATATVTVVPATVTATTTACLIQFADVPADYTFYSYVRCLACRNIIGGYECGGPGEPCDEQHSPYFRPSQPVMRGQIAKMVAQAASFTEPPGPQVFEDVEPGSTFYTYTNQLANRNIMGGYACGGEGKPCVLPDKRPYFRPSDYATRGQISKIVAGAAYISDTPTSQTFEDVPPTDAFYTPIQQLAYRSVIGGYTCGGPGEPCVMPDKRPYFRTQNTVTRGQASKITANTLLPNCQTLARP